MDQREDLYAAGKWPSKAISPELRRKLQEAMDAPMTDLEAVQTVYSMFEVMRERMKVATESEQLTLLALVVRSVEVMHHLQKRLNIAA